MTSSPHNQHAETARLYRLVMLGQGGSGKSNIADRFVKNTYTDPHKVTLGVEYQTKLLALENGSHVKFEIWDTSGQERYSALAPMYYRGAHAGVIVYDITDRRSFQRAKEWVGELQMSAISDIVILLVGNKIDLEEHRAVDTLDAEVYADDNALSFAEVSAKTGVGIQEMFEHLALRLTNDPSMASPPSARLQKTKDGVRPGDGRITVQRSSGTENRQRSASVGRGGCC